MIERRIEEDRLMKRLVALVAASTIFVAGPAGAADSLTGTT
jgi:hypothetical protein